MQALHHLQRWIHELSEDHDSLTIAVSGGRSPIPLFESLAESDLPWSRIAIALVDERTVGQGHAASNSGLVKRHLLRGKASAATLLSFMPDTADIYPDPQPWADQANLVLGNRPLHLVLLGMGTDGHTASLFPAEPDLAAAIAPQATRYVPMTLHQPPAEAPFHRVSLSLPAILSAQRRMLSVAGAQKRAVLAQARQAASAALPISLVLHASEHPTLVLEEE
ncbi:MAG: 6-phosphogluconolactonase [Pseudomonadota bacterium]|jgi:6-phosphogluconolactonase